MAKYTTEVRSICESKAGYEEGKGGNNVDTVLGLSWDKIFTTNCHFFDDNYKPVLCKKILKHYYTREIGAETAGLWVLWMNTKLEEIMPYYNQLYESELIEFNPMHNMNLTKTGNSAGAEQGTEAGTLQRINSSADGGTRRTATSDTGSTTQSVTTSGQGSTSDSGSSERDIHTVEERDIDKTVHNRDAYSDTPQGTISNVESNAYLTNYRHIAEDEDTSDDKSITTSDDVSTSNSGSYSDSGSSSTTGSDSKTGSETITYGKTNSLNTAENQNKTHGLNTTEQYIESVVGNNGTYNFSKLLNDFRDTFLNIDLMVINEFKDLFFKLW